MSDYVYTYGIEQFPNEKCDLSKLDREIRASDIVVSLNYLSGSETDVDIFFRAPLEGKDHTTLSGLVAVHDGEDDYADYSPVKIVAADSNVKVSTDLIDEWRDRSGKLRVHQTSRKFGTRVMWTGCGDSPSNPSLVGGGERFNFSYNMGDTEPLVKYIDFNIVENETWLHEGYLTWASAQMDTLDLQMVPRVTSYTVSSGTNYNLYGGYIVIPAAPGTGTVNITSDITTHSGGLVYMPNDDLDTPPTAFWNAEWNSSTKAYENITPVPYGNGRYNMFTVEVCFAHFVRDIPLLGSGFIALNSSDTDQMGHGMRLKMTADTNDLVDDHSWQIACIMCLHRERST